MENDVYKAPESSLEVSENEQVLASRRRRLGASLIDSILLMTPSLIAIYYLGWFEHIKNGTFPSVWYTVSLFAFGVVIYLAVNYRSLKENGQTIGKKVLNIKIVDLENNKPNMNTLILKRYAPYVTSAQVPIVGQFTSLINILFIFGKQKRCIHDYIAKTKVVNS